MPLLTKRFNEREESVRVDIIQCVGTIVEEIGKTSRLDTATLYHESKKRKGSDGGLVSNFNTPQFVSLISCRLVSFNSGTAETVDGTTFYWSAFYITATFTNILSELNLKLKNCIDL
ncbi:hypothetical protein BC833DRAFT_588439 [Globomyces pollinis-pini]|nr:hypothetical protein BC833DRAFT_588439 [Globomyces pollinis-pini]